MSVAVASCSPVSAPRSSPSSVVTYGWDLSDDEISSASLLDHSFVGTAG